MGDYSLHRSSQDYNDSLQSRGRTWLRSHTYTWRTTHRHKHVYTGTCTITTTIRSSWTLFNWTPHYGAYDINPLLLLSNEHVGKAVTRNLFRRGGVKGGGGFFGPFSSFPFPYSLPFTIFFLRLRMTPRTDLMVLGACC